MSQTLPRIEEIDNYGGPGDEMLVDSNMIPAVEMEVVMTGDGHVEEEYAPTSPYHYDYGYEDNEMSHYESKLLPVALASNQGGERRDWKTDQKLKMDLYEVLDALPPHMHAKYIKMFAKRGVSLDSKKTPSAQQEFIFNQQQQQQQQQSSAPTKTTRQYFYSYGTHYDKAFKQQNTESNFTKNYDYGGDDFSNSQNNDSLYSGDHVEKTNPTDRLCPGCNMVLRRSVFYHHARMIRERGACNLFTPQRFPCPHCEQKLGTLEKLCHHLEQIHEAPTQIKVEMFNSEEEFTNFRIELEGKGANFRMARGNKKNKKGIVQYFRCNRLQTLSRQQTYRLVDNPQEGDLPSNKRRGRLLEKPGGAKQVIRTENSCTAFYNKAYLPNGTIEVRYCDHHLHDDERLRLPDAIRARVIELARKQLPHLVVLMIVKDERYKYCERNSANDRRVVEMKAQDVRQILAGNNRQERTRVRRGGQSRNRIQLVDNGDGLIIPTEEDPNSDWVDLRPIPTQRVNRGILTATERRYLDLFDTNREEVMQKINHRNKVENEKRTIYESFVHRATSAHQLFKRLDFMRITPTAHHFAQLEKALGYIERMQEVLRSSRKEPRGDRNQSFLQMMEEKNRELMMHRDKAEDIDVVGMDQNDQNDSYENSSLDDIMKKNLYSDSHFDSRNDDLDAMELQRAVLNVNDMDDDDEEREYVPVPVDHNPPSMSMPRTSGKRNNSARYRKGMEGNGEEEEVQPKRRRNATPKEKKILIQKKEDDEEVNVQSDDVETTPAEEDTEPKPTNQRTRTRRVTKPTEKFE